METTAREPVNGFELQPVFILTCLRQAQADSETNIQCLLLIDD